MKKARKVAVGDVIQFPLREFAPLRHGWNGWLFRAGIVERLYISKSGRKCATVRYCSRVAGRYQLLPNTEATINVLRDCLFEYGIIDQKARWYREGREAERNGEEVCWDEDTALLVNHGFIEEV